MKNKTRNINRHRLVKGWASGSPDTPLPFDSFEGCRQLDAFASEILSRYNLPTPLSPTPVCRTINKVAPMPRAAPTFGDAYAKPAAPDYFVPRALAKRWSVCVDKVLMFIRTGELRAFNVASATSSRPRYRISIDEVRRFEEKTRSAAPPHAAGDKTARRRKTSVIKPRRTYF
jgi:hypothetical protein